MSAGTCVNTLDAWRAIDHMVIACNFCALPGEKLARSQANPATRVNELVRRGPGSAEMSTCDEVAAKAARGMHVVNNTKISID